LASVLDESLLFLFEVLSGLFFLELLRLSFSDYVVLSGGLVYKLGKRSIISSMTCSSTFFWFELALELPRFGIYPLSYDSSLWNLTFLDNLTTELDCGGEHLPYLAPSSLRALRSGNFTMFWLYCIICT
jgi:hypothetical protein